MTETGTMPMTPEDDVKLRLGMVLTLMVVHLFMDIVHVVGN